MDEEEIEGLLPRTELDNASQPSVNAEEVILGGAGLGSVGFFNQTGRMPKPVINTSSPATPTFQPPAVQGPASLTTTQPTSLTTTRPTSLTTTRPTTLTNVPRATPNYNVNYGGATAGGARLLGAAGMKGALAFGAGYGIGTGINQGSQFIPGMDGDKISDKLAPVMYPDVYQNSEALDKSFQLQSDFRNETQRLQGIENYNAAKNTFNQGIGLNPPSSLVDQVTQAPSLDLPALPPVAEAQNLSLSEAMGQLNPPSGMGDFTAQGPVNILSDVKPETSFTRADGGPRGEIYPGDRIANSFPNNPATALIGSPIDPNQPEDYQGTNLPGGIGYQRPPEGMVATVINGKMIFTTPENANAIARRRNERPASAQMNPVAPAQMNPVAPAQMNPVAPSPGDITTANATNPASTGLIGTGPVDMSNTGSNRPVDMSNTGSNRPVDMSNTGSNRPVDMSNTGSNRPVTQYDALNPALENMSAGEKLEAMNAPGYQTPTSLPSLSERETSRFAKGYKDYTDVTGMAADVVYGTGKMLASPFILAKNYLGGTEDNLNPTLREAASETFDTVAATPISDFMSGETAAPLPSEVLNAQDARNVEFLANESVNGAPVERPNYGEFLDQQTALPGGQPVQTTILPGEEGSPQRYFNNIISQRPLNEDEIQAGYKFADERGFDFNPQTGFSAIRDPGSRTYSTPVTSRNYQARGLTLGQFLRYENDPSQRTEQFVDAQGRLRRRLTVDAAILQGYSPQEAARNRPLAPEYMEAEATGDKMIADLRAKEAADQDKRDGVRSDGRLSDGDLRKIFGSGDALRKAKALRDNGINPLTMEPESVSDGKSEEAELRLRILKAEADAIEQGKDPNVARINELRAEKLEEELNQLRKKGLPKEITFEPGERGTVVVLQNGSAIGYFREELDAATELGKLGISTNDTMNATPVDSGSGDTVIMTDREKRTRYVSKKDVQEAIKNGYTIGYTK